MLGAVTTTGLGWWVGRATAARGRPFDNADVTNRAGVRGSLEWALSHVGADAASLLSAAGDLERVAARHPRDDRLIGVFERMLGLALESRLGVADAAAACAVRSLELLGAVRLVQARGPSIAQRADFVQTERELEFVLSPRPGSTGK